MQTGTQGPPNRVQLVNALGDFVGSTKGVAQIVTDNGKGGKGSQQHCPEDSQLNGVQKHKQDLVALEQKRDADANSKRRHDDKVKGWKERSQGRQSLGPFVVEFQTRRVGLSEQELVTLQHYHCCFFFFCVFCFL